MKYRIKSLAAETLSILTTVFPLAVSMASCAGADPAIGIVGAIIAAIALKITGSQSIMPVFVSFSVISFALSAYGIGAACVSVLVCGLLMISTAFLGIDFKHLIFRPAITAIMQATAISVTVLQTTNYFGIGATGNDIGEMLASYTSLGFHPNWRGVLYGTIVMVIMITYPRKLKKLEKTVRAPFVALLFTLILNLFLNPYGTTSAINEIGAYSFSPSEILFQIREFEFSLNSFGAALICGAALFISTAYSVYSSGASNRDYLASGIFNLGASFTCVFLPCKIRDRKSFSVPGIIAAIIILLISLIFRDFIARIPLHSCAVVLIVGAWQSMKWSYYKSIFNDVASIACFLATLAFSLLFGIAGGVLFGALFSCLCMLQTNHIKIKTVK